MHLIINCPRKSKLTEHAYFWLEVQFTLNIKVSKGVPMDPTFVFRAFYYFCLRFFDRYFSDCLTIGYASFDEKN